MSRNRKRYSATFKMKVAPVAVRGELTVPQLVAKHCMHQTLINAWKCQAAEGMAAMFSDKAEMTQASHTAGVDERRSEAGDDGARLPAALNRREVRIGVDQPLRNGIDCSYRQNVRRTKAILLVAEDLALNNAGPRPRFGSRTSWFRKRLCGGCGRSTNRVRVPRSSAWDTLRDRGNVLISSRKWPGNWSG